MKTYQKISLVFVFLIMGFIFYISSLQFPPNPFPSFSLTSLLYHAGIFFLFSLSLFIASGFNKKFVFVFLVLAVSFLYAVLDELHQYFVPGRVMDIIDLMYNSLGILLSFVIVIIKNGRLK